MTAPVLDWEAKWSGSKVKVPFTEAGIPAFVDECNPASAESRKRMLNRILVKYPTLAGSLDPIEKRLVELATEGPPTAAANTSCAIPANPPAWENPVAGADLLDEIVGVFRRHVIMSDQDAAAVALWVVHTFVFDACNHTPRLLVTSPDKRCGKSLLLRFVGALVARPLSCENISPAALYRSIEKFAPTLALDEADCYLAGKNVNEDLRGVINAGFTKGGSVLRCVGDDSEPTPFNVFAPLAIGMIGRPPATIEDRSVIVVMRRKLAEERVDRLPPGRMLRDLLHDTVRRLVRWATDFASVLAESDPRMPAALDDRAADLWFVLLAIADAAGGTWPARARAAAITLSSGRDAIDTPGMMLLQDLRLIFTEQAVDRLKTASIVTLLAKRTDRPWTDYRRGRAINERQVGRLLEPFGIKSRQFRVPSDPGNAVRGFVAEDFADAWGRYLPEQHEASQNDPVTRDTVTSQERRGWQGDSTRDTADSVTGRPVTPDAAVTGPIDRQPSKMAGYHGVTGRSPENAPTTMGELHSLISELLDDVIATPAAFPFTGDELRAHYRNMVMAKGPSVALGDARRRRQAQVEMRVEPLTAEGHP